MRRLILALFVLLLCSTAWAKEIVLDNGKIEVRMDLSRYGGSISYLSLSGLSLNLVNTADKGRLIQQSYYMGQDREMPNQHRSWRPWPINPIQGGDVYNNPARVIESEHSRTMAYVKTAPKLWDLRNVEPPMTMEQWVLLDGYAVRVLVRFTAGPGAWERVPRHQEMPAVYIISWFDELHTYLGSRPWTNARTTKITRKPLPNDPAFPWNHWPSKEYPGQTENWAAIINSGNQLGVGVIFPDAELFVGGLHGRVGQMSNSASTMYVAPLRTMDIRPGQVVEYQYELMIGSLADIRRHAYSRRK